MTYTTFSIVFIHNLQHNLPEFYDFQPDGSSPSALFSKSGNFGNKWYKAEIDLNYNSSFTLAFSATARGYTTGDIAIDDVSVTMGLVATRSHLLQIVQSLT